MKRHNQCLVLRCGQMDEVDRQKWTTYANFNDMYSHTIDEMVSAGVAKSLMKLSGWTDKVI